MITAKQNKALNILVRHKEGITASRFAAEYFTEPEHEYLFTSVSNQGNGACAGKKAWLCAGSLLGKLAAKGYATAKPRSNPRTFVLTHKGEEALKEYRRACGGYPKAIAFRTKDPGGFTADARDWLERIQKETTMEMPLENILRITYPADIVERIRCVNVDDCIYRLDFIDPGDRFHLCNCLFPNVPWNNREFMQGRWKEGRRTEGEGSLTIEYPEKNN